MDQTIIFSVAKGQLPISQDNPLFGVDNFSLLDSSIESEQKVLIPIESLSKEDWQKLAALSKNWNGFFAIQTFLVSSQSLLEQLHSMPVPDFPIQIWLRDTIPVEIVEHSEQFKSWKIEWVYSPYLVVRPNEMKLERIPTRDLTINIQSRKNSYDATPDPIEFWHLITWIVRHLIGNGRYDRIGCLVSKTCLNSLPRHHQDFLLHPTHDAYLEYLQKESSSLFIIQSFYNVFVKFIRPSAAEFFLWPIKKPYWFLQFQFQKVSRYLKAVRQEKHANPQ